MQRRGKSQSRCSAPRRRSSRSRRSREDVSRRTWSCRATGRRRTKRSMAGPVHPRATRRACSSPRQSPGLVLGSSSLSAERSCWSTKDVRDGGLQQERWPRRRPLRRHRSLRPCEAMSFDRAGEGLPQRHADAASASAPQHGVVESSERHEACAKSVVYRESHLDQQRTFACDIVHFIGTLVESGRTMA